MLYLVALIAVGTSNFEPLDLSNLPAAIDRCDRKAVLPIFAAEEQRRSASLVTFYQEQSQIVSDRIETTSKQRALREPALSGSPDAAAGESERALALRQLALDDRQRALDDLRRLEGLRQQAVDMNRRYFLTHCAGGKAGYPMMHSEP